MRKSTPAEASATSPVFDSLPNRLGQRMTELLAVVAAFHSEPVTPARAFAFEKKSLRRFATRDVTFSSTL